jgi:16S rRNA (adenine1518-N6/adenine1519-N6)-dimethyltransferase
MHRHAARKRFGQHFLHDKQIIQRLLDVIAVKQGQHFVEIGPGQGALTVPILKIIGELDVVEIDRDLIPHLKMRCADKGNLIVHSVDALEFNFGALAKSNQLLRVIGNLPYNISTPLIFHLLEYASSITDMHFMLQKEVVDRITAGPNDEAYGRLSIMVQYHCKTVPLFHVPPTAFYPPPQVDSKIIRLVPHKDMPFWAQDYQHFTAIVREAFSHRRKTLRNSLKDIVSDEKWQQIDIDSQRRPEQLGVEEYVKISNTLIET